MSQDVLPMGDIEKRQVTRNVTVKLTAVDHAQFAIEMGELHALAAEKQRDLDKTVEETTKPLKAEIGQARAKIETILDVINTGEQIRAVEVTEEKYFEQNLVRYVYEDTVVEERAMTADERQASMFPAKQEHEVESDAAPLTPEEQRADIASVIQDERNPNKPSLVDSSV